MKTLKLLLPTLVVALALVAFASTADAATVTKKTVKKVAAKVVAAQAPNLTVKRAATAGLADNATQLAGKPAAAYQSATVTFTLAQSPYQSTTKTYELPVAAGTWLASYSIGYATAQPVRCHLEVVGFAPELGIDHGASYSNEATCAATVQLTTDGSKPVELHVSGGNMALLQQSTQLSTVTFTRVDTSTFATGKDVTP